MTLEEMRTFDILSADLVVFDTEFTSLDFQTNELLEIGFVKLKALTHEVLTEGDIKIKADLTHASEDSLKLIGYNQEEWDKEAVTPKEGLEEFLKHTDSCVLVAHNIANDWMVIKNALAKSNLKENFHYKSIDTFTLGWYVLQGKPEFTTFSLREMAKYFKVDQGQKHRAIDDARATAEVFKKLISHE